MELCDLASHSVFTALFSSRQFKTRKLLKLILQTIPYTKGKVVTDLSQTDPLQDNHRSVFDTIACMLHNYALYASYRTTTCISHASHLLVLTAAIHSKDSLNLYMVMTDLLMTAIIFIYHECHL